MHFSKTYTELLLSLPPELRDNAIEYRKLKKLIKQVVQELTQLGACKVHERFLHSLLISRVTPKVSPRTSYIKSSSSRSHHLLTAAVKEKVELSRQISLRLRCGFPSRHRRTQRPACLASFTRSAPGLTSLSRGCA